MTLLFLPLTTQQLAGWAGGGILPGQLPGYAVTPGLLEVFELADPEDAEHVALLVASIAALASAGRRLVAVVEGSHRPAPDADDDFGEVIVADLRYPQVRSLFADEPNAPGLAEAAAAVAGLPLAEAWEHAAVAALLEGADLLWHGPGEWETLITG